MVLDTQKIRRLLRERHISQRQLANMIDATPVAVSQWLCGRNQPNLQPFIKMADVLKVVDVRELMKKEHYEE